MSQNPTRPNVLGTIALLVSLIGGGTRLAARVLRPDPPMPTPLYIPSIPSEVSLPSDPSWAPETTLPTEVSSEPSLDLASHATAAGPTEAPSASSALDLTQAELSQVERACADAQEMRRCLTTANRLYEGSPAAARKAFGIACSRGSAVACVNLGILWETGRGGPQDYERARRSYEVGCAHGETIGCANLGAMNRRGRGVKKNLRSALIYFKRGCDGGDADGCFGLAEMNENGEGTSKDTSLAEHYFQRACRLSKQRC